MISIICAIASNNIIGCDNKLIWHIPSDLKRFKEITSGHTMVMGRKTFESLPGVLPNRKHIVITHDENYKIDDERVEIFHSIDDIIKKYKDSEEEVFIIGGGEIYKLFINYADKMYLTILNESFNGDTYFPEIDMNNWITTDKSDPIIENNIEYYFIDIKRKEDK